MLSYVVAVSMPLLIFVCIVSGIIYKKDVFALFIQGASEGLKMTIKIFPHMLAITVAVTLLKDTKALDVILLPLENLFECWGIPKAIVPVALLRSVSGRCYYDYSN